MTALPSLAEEIRNLSHAHAQDALTFLRSVRPGLRNPAQREDCATLVKLLALSLALRGDFGELSETARARLCANAGTL